MAACLARLRGTAGVLIAAQHKCRGRIGAVRRLKAKKTPDVELKERPGGARGVDEGAGAPRVRVQSAGGVR